jgi:hypothetical protein
MGYLSDYRAYLKNNPEGYWFRRKLFGWGWTPATWQGWVVVVVFLAIVVINAVNVDSTSHSVSDTLIGVAPRTVVLLALLLLIAWKTGEPPKWQWGNPQKH